MITLYAVVKEFKEGNFWEALYLCIDDGAVSWQSFSEKAKTFDKEIVFDIVRTLNFENKSPNSHYSVWAIPF